MDQRDQLLRPARDRCRRTVGPRRRLRTRLRSQCEGAHDDHARIAQTRAPDWRRPATLRRDMGGRHRRSARGLRSHRCDRATWSICRRRARPAVTREVVWDHGVSLPGHRLWLDPLVVRSFAFISHAHTDHARRHTEALRPPQPRALIPEARRPRGWRMLGYDEPMRRGAATVTLHPAG